MARQGETVAQANRRIRQEELREKLVAQGHLEQVIKNIEKIEALKLKPKEGSEEIEYKDYQYNTFELQRLDKAISARLKLVNKYLPDLKATEVTGEGGEDIRVAAYEINFFKS